MVTTTAERPEIPPNAEYQSFLDAGRFLIQRDLTTGKAFFYPRVSAPLTGSVNLEWFEPSGLGTVYAVTVVSQRPPSPGYNVVLVDLEEGPRVMSRVEGIVPESVHIGMAVRARVQLIDGTGVLLFDPLDEAKAAI